MNRKTLLGLVFAASLLVSRSVCAETIILKSGKNIVGEITEETDDFVKITCVGIDLTFFSDEIERVEGAEAPVSEAKPRSETPEQDLGATEAQIEAKYKPKGTGYKTFYNKRGKGKTYIDGPHQVKVEYLDGIVGSVSYKVEEPDSQYFSDAEVEGFFDRQGGRRSFVISEDGFYGIFLINEVSGIYARIHRGAYKKPISVSFWTKRFWNKIESDIRNKDFPGVSGVRSSKDAPEYKQSPVSGRQISYFRHGTLKTVISSVEARVSPLRDNEIQVKLYSSGKFAGEIKVTFSEASKKVERISLFRTGAFTEDGKGFSTAYGKGGNDPSKVTYDGWLDLRYSGREKLGTRKIVFEWDFDFEKIKVE